MKKILLLTCAFFTLLFSSCNKDDYSDLTTPSVEDEVIRIDFSEAETTPEFFNQFRQKSHPDFEIIEVNGQVELAKVANLLHRDLEFSKADEAIEVTFVLPDGRKAISIAVPMINNFYRVFTAFDDSPDSYFETISKFNVENGYINEVSERYEGPVNYTKYVEYRAWITKEQKATMCKNSSAAGSMMGAAAWFTAGFPPVAFAFGAMGAISGVVSAITCF
jgi:hypothetical protein